MAEATVAEEQEEPRPSNNSNVLGLISFSCLNAGVILFGVFFLVQDKEQSLPILSSVLMGLAVFMWLAAMIFWVLRRKRSSIQTPQIVISSIPTEDLEKTSPTQFCNHAPFLDSYSIDLRDCFTSVQNTGDVCSSVDADVCTEDFTQEILPPCYEQALKMPAKVSTSRKAENTL